MSKIQDQMRALMGKYSGKKAAARPAPRKTPAAQTRKSSAPSPSPSSSSKTNIDLVLDKVVARKSEVTLDASGYTEAQVQAVVKRAEARGLSVSRDRRFLLIRDLSGLQIPSHGSPLPGFHLETLRGVAFLVSDEHPRYAAYKPVPRSNDYTIVDIHDPAHIERIAGSIAPELLRSSISGVVAELARRGTARSSAPSPRTPPGFSQVTVEGVKVLVHPDYPNYVAARREGSPTYDLIQLAPRESFSVRVPANGILYQFDKRDQYVKAKLENEKEAEEAAAAERKAWNNQPGFYVVPGETEDPDGETVGAEGPYHDLEQAIEEAAATQASLKPSDTRSVLVVESQNPREAAAGRGHVWWKDDAFRGPPVDPRQQGFRF